MQPTAAGKIVHIERLRSVDTRARQTRNDRVTISGLRGPTSVAKTREALQDAKREAEGQ